VPLTNRPAYFSLDRELRFSTANEAIQQFLGRDPQALRGRPLLEVLPEAEGTEFLEVILEAQRTFRAQKGRLFSQVNGIWVDFEVHPVGDTIQVGFAPA
jgi:PAS domain-containing protein